MQIEVLGSSSFIPTIKGSWSSFLINLGKGDRILIDAGTRRLLGRRKDVLSVSHIFITHRHPDHIMFLGALLSRMKRNHRKKPLTIFCPENAFYHIIGFIRFYNPSGVPDFVNFETFTPDEPEYLITLPKSNTEMWAAAACHTTMAAGYGIIQGDTKVVIVPDTAPNCKTLLALAKDAKALFHDATFPTAVHNFAATKGHSSPEGAGLDAAKAGVETLVLIHTSRARARDDHSLFAGAARYFAGEIHVGSDNTKFTF
ncbi:MAG: MBL fold metallo-hydrolase [Promethearchaeota archaeon]